MRAKIVSYVYAPTGGYLGHYGNIASDIIAQVVYMYMYASRFQLNIGE